MCVCLQDLEELLNRVNSADSAVSLERSGAVLVDLLQKARERHRKITAEEMNTVLQERDTAQAKVRPKNATQHHTVRFIIHSFIQYTQTRPTKNRSLTLKLANHAHAV